MAGAGLPAREEGSGDHRAVLQHRRPAADRALRHGAAQFRRAGAARRADHGVRRRHADPLFRPRARCGGGLLRLLGTPAALGEVFNVGSDGEVTILRLAELVRAPRAARPRSSSSPTRRPTTKDSRTCSAVCRTSRNWRESGVPVQDIARDHRGRCHRGPAAEDRFPLLPQSRRPRFCGTIQRHGTNWRSTRFHKAGDVSASAACGREI